MTRWRAVCAASVAAAVWAGVGRGTPAIAQVGGRPGVLRELDQASVDEKGDATYSGKLSFPTETAYQAIKSTYPNPYVLLRNLIGTNGKTEASNATVSYDDGARSVSFAVTLLGAAMNKEGNWQVSVGQGCELLHQDGQTAILLNVLNLGGASAVMSCKLQLPTGAGQAAVDADAGVLSYPMDRPPKSGKVGVRVDVKVKPRLMSALYKVYGDADFADGIYWTGKTVFTNTGTGDVNHLRVSYRLGEYTDDWSTPVEYGVVAPGGHVVDLYYPMLKQAIATLKSQTRAELQVKYSYEDAAGKTVENVVGKKVTLLGANQFEYSNVPDRERAETWTDWHGNDPLEAAFVTKMDDPVRALAGLAAQACHGQPAGESDEAAELFCQALYNLELANGLSYAWGVVDDVGRGNTTQSLKYPRDVLRDKSGTCIELALLFAAACESEGLKCHLVNIPGHTFPVVMLPSGTPMPVESTAISAAAIPLPEGQKRDKPYTFVEAVNIGRAEMAQVNQKPYTDVDVDTVQGKGVVCPELPALPANVMDSWGWHLPTAAAENPNGEGRGGNPEVVNANNGNGNGNGGNGGNPLNDTGGGGNGGNNPDPNGGGGGGAAADDRHPDVLVGIWEGQTMSRNGPCAIVIQLERQGGLTVVNRSQTTGMQATYRGTWYIDDRRQYVSAFDGQQPQSFSMSLDGDTWHLSNPTVGVNLQLTRRR